MNALDLQPVGDGPNVPQPPVIFDEMPNERMRRLREARGLSLQALANAVGMSKAHVWEIECSAARMEKVSYINLCNIAGALGVSLSVLMQSSTQTQ